MGCDCVSWARHIFWRSDTRFSGALRTGRATHEVELVESPNQDLGHISCELAHTCGRLTSTHRQLRDLRPRTQAIVCTAVQTIYLCTAHLWM